MPSRSGIAGSLAAQQVVDDGQTMGGVDVAAVLELGRHLVDGDADAQNGLELLLVRLRPGSATATPGWKVSELAAQDSSHDARRLALARARWPLPIICTAP